MKKVIPLILLFFILSFCTANPSTSNARSGERVISGMVISGISPDAFTINNANIPIGLIKVSEPTSIRTSTVYGHSHNIPVYYKINLFEYTIQSTRQMNIDDLKNHYSSISPDDFSNKEIALSALYSYSTKDGNALTYTTKSEPEIEVTYKYESTKQGYIKIPERHVVFKNEIVTHFLLDPLKPILNERISPFDLSRIYEIDTALYNTIVARAIENNTYLDFDGFYLDLPSIIPDESYRKVITDTLEYLKKYLDSIGKKLIIGNITDETIDFANYADIVNINYDRNIEFMSKARKYIKKPTIVTYNGVINSAGNLEDFLQKCLFFGFYPEFGRDTSTGDFFYFEKILGSYSDILNKYLDKIVIEEIAGFTTLDARGDLLISRFGVLPFEITNALGKGSNYIATKTKGNLNVVARDFSGDTIDFGKDEQVIKREVEGFDYVEVIPTFSFFISGNINKAPSTKGKLSIQILNASGAKYMGNLTEKRADFSYTYSIEFQPLEFKEISLEGNTTQVLIDEQDISEFQKPRGKFDSAVLVFFVFFVALILILVNKKTPSRRLSKKAMIPVLIGISLALFLLNHFFIHYSPISLNYFMFGAMFIIYAFYTDAFKYSLFSGVLLIFVGLLFNFFEFGTIMPVQFSAYPPFGAYQLFFFYLPFIFAVFYFSAEFPNNIAKSEVLVIFAGVLSITFVPYSTSLPFLFTQSIWGFVPFFTICFLYLASRLIIFKGDFKSFFKMLSICGIILLLIMGSILYVRRILSIPPDDFWSIVFIRDISLLISPLFFILVSARYRKIRNPKISLNIFVLTLLAILAGYFALSHLTLRVFGIPYISMFIGYVVPIILVMFSLLFFERIYD